MTTPPLPKEDRAHTPGPWAAELVRPDGLVWIVARTDPEFNEFVRIAAVAPWNASLIAAAPDLLKACAAAMAGYPGWDKMIHEAYAKATGATP
jgi:hypothetical protein